MTLSETISTAEGRISEAVETGRSRLRAVVDTAEESVEATLPRLREQLVVWRERSFEDAERVGGYVTDALTWVAGRLPTVRLPFASQLPSVEDVANTYFETAGRVLATHRKLTLDWIGALHRDAGANNGAAKAKSARSKKEERPAA
jgi:hypothetical protein